jgi:hypothetical protein
MTTAVGLIISHPGYSPPHEDIQGRSVLEGKKSIFCRILFSSFFVNHFTSDTFDSKDTDGGGGTSLAIRKAADITAVEDQLRSRHWSGEDCRHRTHTHTQPRQLAFSSKSNLLTQV